jgi:uncharacterized membrane protein YphA (DoxX/SURF4 family)
VPRRFSSGSDMRSGDIDILSVGFAVVRFGLAAVFLYAGADRLRHWRESLADVTELGLSLPATFTGLTIATELLGGAMVASGVGAVPGAVALAGFTALAALLGHRFWLLYGQPSGREFTTALEHVAIVAALAMFALGRVAA